VRLFFVFGLNELTSRIYNLEKQKAFRSKTEGSIKIPHFKEGFLMYCDCRPGLSDPGGMYCPGPLLMTPAHVPGHKRP
jgi:hypothetical protein